MTIDKHSVELSSQALKYFEKRLLLSENLSELDDAVTELDEIDTSSEIENTTPSPELPAPIAESIKEDAYSDAKSILSNFPIDRSRFAPEREYLIQGSIFDEYVDPDKILNSLLFATKLAFFDVSDSESSIIREVSEDSFGYMNILRHNQIKILDSEVIKLNNKIDYLNDSQFLTNIDLLKDYKEQDTEDLNGYLTEITKFYALNVMNNPSVENVALINDWLNKKLGNIK
jgi:hypothetical protein